MSELTPGDIFAGHRIEGIAGRGGMGVVYRATQLDLERTVALKLIAAQLAEDDSFRERFVRESRVAASIDDPHVIPIYYAGDSDGTLYLAMRYVDGRDLRALIRGDGPMEPDRATRVVAQVAAALDAAHARGLVHRDVKPANVLLTADDHAYLTDFGLTKRLLETTGLSRTGQWVGTLGYVAPEQIRGQRIDARTDVFALGCVLFYALTGVTPFQRESDEATLWAHLNDPPEPVDVLAPGVPSEFVAVIDRALAKEPDDRFPSAGDLARAAQLAAGDSVSLSPERTVARGAAAPVTGDATQTAHSPTRVADRQPDRSEARSRPGAGVIAGGLAAVAAVVVAIVLLVGGGSSSKKPQHAATTPVRHTTTATTSTTPAPPTSPGQIATNVNTGIRVNNVALLDGIVYVASHQSRKIVTLDERTGKRVASPITAPLGTSSMASGLGSLWILSQTSGSLERVQRNPLRITHTPVLNGADFGGQAVTLAVGEGAVWVGVLTPGHDVPDIVTKMTPTSHGATIAKQFSVSGTISDIAAGYGSVWVIAGSHLVRISARTGAQQSTTVPSPQAVALGKDAAWVTNASLNAITKIPRGSTLGVRYGPTGESPRAIDVDAGNVWVAGQSDGTIARFDTSTGRAVGSPLPVCGDPYAIAADASGAWVGCVDQHVVQIKP